MVDNPKSVLSVENTVNQQPMRASALGSQFSPTQKQGQADMHIPLTSEKMEVF